MRVALVHDWLTGMRGGERCLEEFLEIYPKADIYTLVHEPGSTTPQIDSRVSGTSWLQSYPRLRKRYRAFLPLFPQLARSVVIRDYDLVISLSHAAAKNVRLVNVKKHICYCFTPMRYIWDMAPVYLGHNTVKVLWPLIQYLRKWDQQGAEQVDHFVAISRFVASRIRKYYGRNASVVYPPVQSKWGAKWGGSQAEPAPETSNKKVAFLYAGAFVPYKGVEHIITAFNRLQLPLWCVGSGPLERQLRAKAGANITFLGSLTDAELAEAYRSCRALIFPPKEDFGIIPIEALLSGAPVIAGYHGATRESIPGFKPWKEKSWDSTRHAGIFFPVPRGSDRFSKERYASALEDAVREFLRFEHLVDPETAIAAGRRFSSEEFRVGWNGVLQQLGLAEDRPRVANL